MTTAEINTLKTLAQKGWRIYNVADRRVRCTGYTARTPEGDFVTVYIDGNGVVIYVS